MGGFKGGRYTYMVDVMVCVFYYAGVCMCVFVFLRM